MRGGLSFGPATQRTGQNEPGAGCPTPDEGVDNRNAAAGQAGTGPLARFSEHAASDGPAGTPLRDGSAPAGTAGLWGLPRPTGLCTKHPASTEGDRGQVAEWLNAPHSKCGIPARVSGVQIPPCPPLPDAYVLSSLTSCVAGRSAPHRMKAIAAWCHQSDGHEGASSFGCGGPSPELKAIPLDVSRATTHRGFRA